MPQRELLDGLARPTKRCRIQLLEKNEIAKLTDRDYMNWECVRTFPAVLASMVKENEFMGASRPAERTVLAPSEGISDVPLPMLFRWDS
jgi:hypothetical protein